MTVDNALPDRPLSVAEVAVLAEADGIDGVEPVVHDAETGGVVCVALSIGDEVVTLGWHPERREWADIDRQDSD